MADKLGYGGYGRYQMTTRDLILQLQHHIDVLKILHDRHPVPYQQAGVYAQMTDALNGGVTKDLWDAHLILQQACRNWEAVEDVHKDRPEELWRR